MARPTVKGTWDGKPIELYDAATEATLEKLVDAMNKKSSSSGREAKKLAKQTNNQADASKKAAKQAETLAEELDGLGNIIPSIGSLFSGFGSILSVGSSALSGLTKSAFSLADTFLTGGDRLSSLFGSLPLVGTITANIDDTIDSFREVSRSGASFNNSLLEFRQTANVARLSLDEFQRVVTDNSDTFAQLGGTVTRGSRIFAEFSGAFRTGAVGERLMGMGMTMGEINDYLASFLEIQLRRGRREAILDRNRNELAQDYILQLDELAKLTGQQRSEVADNLEQQAADAQFRAFARQAETEEQRKRIQNNLQFLQSQGELGTAIMDLADGVAQTDLGKMLQAQVPQIQRIAQSMGQGMMSVEQARAALGGLAPQLRDLEDSFGPETIQALRDGAPALGDLLDQVFRFERFYRESVSNMAGDEQNRQQSISEFLLGFEQTITDVRTTIEQTVLDSPVFALLTRQFERLTGAVDSEAINNALNKFESEFERFNAWFTGFVTDIEQEGLWPALKSAITDIFNNLRTFIFGGEYTKTVNQGPPAAGTREVTEVREGLIKDFSEGLSNWYDTSGLKSVFEQMADDIVRMFSESLFGEDPTKEQAAEILNIRDTRDKLDRLAREGFYDTPDGRVPTSRGALLGLSRENLVSASEAQERLGPILQRLDRREEEIKKSLTGAFAGVPGIRGRPDLSREALEEKLDGRKTGSVGLENFGSGTPMMLHGREAVLTEKQLFNLASGVFSVGARSSLSNIERNINRVDNSQSIEDLTTAIKDFQSTVNADSQQEVARSSTTTNDMTQKLDQLNTTMQDVLTVLHTSNDINHKQVMIARSMTGNMHRGVPV
jgi:uncharacterized phage infection (PIP) family protein YhgE